MALCVKELGECMKIVKAKQLAGGDLPGQEGSSLAHGKNNKAITSHAKCSEMAITLELTRKLIFKLEEVIQVHSDRGKYPNGNTKPGLYMLELLASLRITDDSSHMLM